MAVEGRHVGSDDGWDRAAVGELGELYPALRRFAAVIGRWDVDPDDLVQEAFTKVLTRRRADIRERGPYLRRAIANAATDERRRAGRRATLLHRHGAPEPTTDHYPSDLTDLMELAPKVRALLLLVEVEGYPIADAADAVGMSHSNARVALMRARRRLRADLIEEASGE